MELDRLKEIIAEVMDVAVEDITEETSFADDLDCDSLDVFEIIDSIESEFDIEIPSEEAMNIKTVGDAYQQIKNAAN